MIKKLFERSRLIYVFKKSSFIYGILLPLSIFAAILTSPLLNIIEVLQVLVSLACIMLSMWICTIVAERINNKVLKILYAELKPKEFREAFLHEIESRKPKNWNCYIRDVLSLSYKHEGNFKEAEEMLLSSINSIPASTQKRALIINRMDALLRLTLIYSHTGKLEAAERAWNEVGVHASKIGVPQEFQPTYFLANNVRQMYAGNACDTIDYFEKNNNENSAVPIIKISNTFRLAEAYRLSGYNEKAREQYSIVAENGKDLYIAQKSREYLDSI